MTTSELSMPQTRINVAEWVITIVVLAVLLASYLGAQDWPRGTAFFPVLLSGTGIVLVIVKLAAMALGRDASAYIRVKQEGEIESSCNPATMQNMAGDEDLANEGDIQSDFAAASPAEVLQVVGWLSAFFIALYALGLLIVLPVFTALYLRFVARMSVFGIFFYVMSTSGLIYALFVVLLHLPLPEGALLNFH